jgi:hypothetical protein
MWYSRAASLEIFTIKMNQYYKNAAQNYKKAVKNANFIYLFCIFAP